jgi:hypothetical protein
MEFFKGKTAEIINYTFQTLLVTYLLLLLLEQIWNGFVSTYMNLNILLIIVIIAGVLDVFSEKQKEAKKKIEWKDYAYIGVLALAGFIIIKIKTGELAGLSWIISIIAGALIFLLSLLILYDDEDEENKEDKEEFVWTKRNKLIVLSAVLLTLAALTIFLSFFMKFTASAQIVFGSVYALFLPGFILSFIFFRNKEIETLERIALSFALSITIVPLVVFYLNLIGMKINTINVFLTILCIILTALVALYLLNKHRPHFPQHKKEHMQKYIRYARENNFSDEEIHNELKRSGVHHHHIKQLDLKNRK